MSPYLLGIDIGLSTTKAVVYDLEGRELGFGECRSSYDMPRPRWVERDMYGVWEDCRRAVGDALKHANVAGGEILAVGLAGHGDGLYLVDEKGGPVRPAILSLDSRAHEFLERWKESGMMDEALPLTGQRPFAASPAAVISWIRECEPESLERSRWALSCKDWIKLKLTGEVSTEPTEASASFTDVNSQTYSDSAFRLYGLEEIREKMPPIAGCAEVAGEVSRSAADVTGLVPGTPVVSGMHDVDSSALGTGSVRPGQLCVVSGTWSVNEVVSTEPVIDPRWQCRNFAEPGLWMNMAASPASATNLEWFVRTLCVPEFEQSGDWEVSPFAFASEEVEGVLEEKSRVFYHPFLYGTPQESVATAGFFGVRGWHNRGHLLRAIFEGVVFNHKMHVDALRSALQISEVRLTGGGIRSDLWRQMFADTLDMPVNITNCVESGARGAALCAGVGVGVYDSMGGAVRRAVRIIHTHEPDPKRHRMLSAAYETYTALLDAVATVWPNLE